jgi:hypothetical protein
VPRLWQTGGRQASKASGSESLRLGEGRRFSTFYETITNNQRRMEGVRVIGDYLELGIWLLEFN